MPTDEELELITQQQITQRHALRDEYQNATSTLTTIRDTVSPTNAQAIQAVKYMAKILIFILRYLAHDFER